MDGLSDSMFLVSIQWLKIPMDGLSDSMFLVSIQWLKIPMDELILIWPYRYQILLLICQQFKAFLYQFECSACDWNELDWVCRTLWFCRLFLSKHLWFMADNSALIWWQLLYPEKALSWFNGLFNNATLISFYDLVSGRPLCCSNKDIPTTTILDKPLKGKKGIGYIHHLAEVV